jgi:DNA-directed RNA polymerase beta' subunit
MEMNAHIPQSYEATAELAEIAAVPMQIIRPRDSTPVIAVVQDALAGAYLATRPNNLFTRREFMNMMMKNKRFKEVPEARAQDPETGAPRYNGQQIVGTLFAPINLTLENSMYDSDKSDYNLIKIQEGDFTQGVLDKGIFNKAGKGILHTTYNDYGPKAAVELLDGIQNMMETYLIMKGFSVGISDLIADDDTRRQMEEAIASKKKEIDDLILQIHTDLFTNNSGKSNQEEFEARAIGILNKATGDAGKIGVESLSAENRLMAMVRSGSKGDKTNVAQMIACVGQQAPEGRRIPYGFTDRTLPHYKMYDDGAEARGFVEGSFLRGLTPQEFFFHAMSGREGLIDTAVKSVTGDTEIIIIEDGETKHTTIGEWVDSHLAMNEDIVQNIEKNNMEYLELENSVFIPTTDADGNMSWGEIKAVTRHDPGKQLYQIKTMGGRDVIVTEEQSLLIWDSEKKQFLPKLTPEVSIDDFVPVTMNLPTPPVVTQTIDVSKYLPKSEYLYGTEFEHAVNAMREAMEGRQLIPNGWWQMNNGVHFHVPYSSKARLQRSIVRSNISNIKPGYVYPFTTNRDHALIPDKIELNRCNGLFMGLFLAEGNVDIKSGYVQITNNNDTIRTFVKEWFDQYGIRYIEEIKMNNIGGTSSCVRGYSTILAKLLTQLMGHGAKNKHVPSEAFSAPEEFVIGLLDGYFSGDGTISSNSVEAGSASQRLIEGVNMLCSRIGVFGKVFTTRCKENNVGTQDILPSHRISIRSQWAKLFGEKVALIDENKHAKLKNLNTTEKHRNFDRVNDVVMDKIVEINPISPENYPKMYDLTIPSTFNFGLANGLQVRDTADTGYTQRQLIKAMEDLMTHHDGTVRDVMGRIMQFRYGEDGANSTKLEGISLPLIKLSEKQIKTDFGLEGIDFAPILAPGVDRGDDAELVSELVEKVMEDRKMLVEGVFGSGRSIGLATPLNLERIILNIKVKFKLDTSKPTDLTPLEVLEGINKIIERTQPFNKIWAASLRFHLAPHKIVVKQRFTKEAWNALVEIIVVKNWKAWAVPGELVGIIAAQSIGEPTTQMTLNSVDWDTEIIISKNGRIVTPQIGEFIDDYYNSCKDDTKIQRLPNNQIYIPLDDGNDWKAMSCDEDGNMRWTKLEAITRHPVVNEDGSDTILKVTLESGRVVKATKAKSFLTLQDGKIVGTNGSDLKVGDELPIGNSLALNELNYLKEINLREILPPTDYIYGTEIQKALDVMTTSEDRHWFQKNQGTLFTIPYSRSDAFRDAFQHGRNSNDIRPGNVYNKRMKLDVSQIPETIPLTEDFGFFAGAYLAEGMSNKNQIHITNNDSIYLSKVKVLMDSWNVGTHGVCQERECKKTGIKGTTTSLIIHSTILAKIMKTWFGRVSYEKTLPDWVFQAPDEFIRGLVDGYISGDGTICKTGGSISASSVSEKLLIRMGIVFARYGIYTTNTSCMPEKRNFNSVSRHYILNIPVKYSNIFHNNFKLTIEHKQARLDVKFGKRKETNITCKWKETKDVVWDKIKSIEEVRPMGEGWVYDITVEDTRNFVCSNMLSLKDTFHQAGVAAKSAVTRGVPRLKELLKVTKKPKATSLTISLKPAFRNNKDMVRQVSQDLELTLLKDIVTKAAIYYDPDDEETILPEDRDVIAFFKALEMDKTSGESATNNIYSKWILRFEFDREKMFNKNITMDDVYFVIQNAYGYYGESDDSLHTIYSDYNSQKLVMRIRPKQGGFMYGDDLAGIKKFLNILLQNTIIRGISGIRAVTWRKDANRVELQDGEYKQVNQYLLDTDGSNFVAVLSHPSVDGNRLYSTNIHDIFEQLGIEATRSVLYSEINGLFDDADINYRHLGLLCDSMTHAGRPISVDRYGINKKDNGPLAKACFEETERVLNNAAVFGEMDPVTGVSANIMMGQPIRAGTAFTQILLDEAALPRLLQDLPPIEEEEEEEVNAPTQNMINQELYGEETDACARLETQMNMVLPTTTANLIEEDDIELVEINETKG